MDKEALIAKLNWFYSLELNQVDLYHAQSKTFKNSYSGIVFERCAYLEQQHVDNIGEKIKELGRTPTVLGDILSPIIGRLGGKLISFAGLKDTLMANIIIEQKAMKDYNNLIERLHRDKHGDQELVKILQHNFVDEHMHTEWFRTKIVALKQEEFTLKYYPGYSRSRIKGPEAVHMIEKNTANRKRSGVIKPQKLSQRTTMR
ncbi:ferritin-like domain-containing protein [Candidatus Formimonas warabiya]|uniref:Ferritin/DPS domain-containing protein n=1 Tax=Formimonas warabiya TaxID=1761012 RepID=A0A3G1KY18_FORW1|nr:hypothetical protein DCMF_23625 [Candidatus Formimonas warabiya]